MVSMVLTVFAFRKGSNSHKWKFKNDHRFKKNRKLSFWRDLASQVVFGNICQKRQAKIGRIHFKSILEMVQWTIFENCHKSVQLYYFRALRTKLQMTHFVKVHKKWGKNEKNVEPSRQLPLTLHAVGCVYTVVSPFISRKMEDSELDEQTIKNNQ